MNTQLAAALSKGNFMAKQGHWGTHSRTNKQKGNRTQNNKDNPKSRKMAKCAFLPSGQEQGA